MPPPFEIDVDHAGRRFVFEVHQRSLLFGSAGEGMYYWMDGRQLRRGRAGPNFRPCVDLWWHAVEEAGAAREAENEVDLVLAECYPLVNTARAVQDIYTDAQLYCIADREYSIVDEDGIRQRRSDRSYLLPDDECQRLNALAQTHDSEGIRRELERLFLGELPPSEEMPAYQEAVQAWIGNGICALRTEGREGLGRYTQTVDEWIRRLRRRGGAERVHRFLNMFAYECKVALYQCYCSAWVGILQWLAQNREPNVLGDRFMRLWHHQNRAADDAEVYRDVFCGQVLALHPLSAVVLTSPQHLHVIGRWIGHPDYDALQSSGQIGSSAEYWNLVAMIMIAAHEYDWSRRRWEETRGQSTRADLASITLRARDEGVASPRLVFEDYAAARGIVCSECSAALSYDRYDPADAEDPTPRARVYFRCISCGHEQTVEVGADDLTG